MTKDTTMHVVLEKGTIIEKIMTEFLKEAEIEIKEDALDFIVAEIPDNSENREEMGPPESDIYVWISGLSVEGQIKEVMEKPSDQIMPEELCKSMEQILLAAGNEKKCSYTYKIKSGERSSSVTYYHLLIAVGLKKSASGYIELAEYLIENISEKIKGCGDFWGFSKTEAGRQHLFGDLRKKWILFGKFAEYYMAKNELPPPGILTQLSAERYEGSESEARIYFTKNAIDTIETFSADGKEDRAINENRNNLRMIRKLMEISKRNTVHLYAEILADDKSQKVHTVTELVRCREKEEKDVYVKFSGFMHWSLFIEEREIFAYYHGEYKFNTSEEKYAYLSDINKLEGFDQEKREMIEKLVKILSKQKHGAAAIVFDEKANAWDEAERLCQVKRGTRICESVCYDEETGWNEDVILAVSGIDGALFIDYSGKCLAIGVIVDGEAVKKGNVGRGARYNSIANYVKLKQGCVGIVISEDGMVNVIQYI